jgi:RHH-type rel operon transcriptional repressor/antitoxin RelB
MPAADLKDAQVSVRLPAELKEQMENYAELTGRSKSYVAMEALSEYLAWRIPQVQDLKAAIAAADRVEFADDEEIEAVFAKYDVKPRAAKRVRPAKNRK